MYKFQTLVGPATGDPRVSFRMEVMAFGLFANLARK
jgi:hypothetical protein